MLTTTSTIFLWLFVMNLGIAFGAGLYEHRVVVSQWVTSRRFVHSSRRSGVHLLLFHSRDGEPDGKAGFGSVGRSGYALVESELRASRDSAHGVDRGAEGVLDSLPAARIGVTASA